LVTHVTHTSIKESAGTARAEVVTLELFLKHKQAVDLAARGLFPWVHSDYAPRKRDHFLA